MSQKHLTSHGFALFTILIWGTTFVATKVLLEDMSPIQILVYRFVLGYLALWLLAPKPLRLTDRRQELWFAAAGMTGIAVYQMMENVALTSKQPPLPILEQLGLTAEEANRNVLKLSGGPAAARGHCPRLGQRRAGYPR